MKKTLSFLSLILLSFCGICQEEIKVRIIYDEPVDGYKVSGWFYPFEADSETGQVELHFVPVNGGKELVFSNVGKSEDGHSDWPEKFTGKNIYDRLFQNGNRVPFINGETLHWKYHRSKGSYEESPLFYDAEFQFYDVDFDGQVEFLVNDYYRGRGGNNYVVYEITPRGFEKKQGIPFDAIINSTVFYPDENKIVNYIYEWPYGKYEYTISKDGNGVVKTVKIQSQNN